MSGRQITGICICHMYKFDAINIRMVIIGKNQKIPKCFYKLLEFMTLGKSVIFIVCCELYTNFNAWLAVENDRANDIIVLMDIG